jgi:hypothetical protein
MLPVLAKALTKEMESYEQIALTYPHGHSALHLAAQEGKVQIVERLLFNKANIESTNAFGETALHCAANHHQYAVIQCLLSNRADREARNHDGDTPLDYVKEPIEGTILDERCVEVFFHRQSLLSKQKARFFSFSPLTNKNTLPNRDKNQDLSVKRVFNFER